jgi:uncharacterized membrane protein YfcA
VLLGALAGGFVNGLTGFGTAITAMGLWLYAIPPATAASLAIVCSVISQVQTLPMIWRVIDWPRILPFVVPGVLGVPVGTWLLAQIDPRTFKIVIGLFLVSYSGYVLAGEPATMRLGSAAAFSAAWPVCPACCPSCGPTSAAGARISAVWSCKRSTCRSSRLRCYRTRFRDF